MGIVRSTPEISKLSQSLSTQEYTECGRADPKTTVPKDTSGLWEYQEHRQDMLEGIRML
jgi:hypothetical protein